MTHALNVNARETEARRALMECLSEVPGISVKEVAAARAIPSAEAAPDAAIRVTLARKRLLVIAEFKGNGQPRIAREAAHRLLRAAATSDSAYCVFLAPYVSSEAAGILKGLGVGYVDLAGNCRIAFEGVYIERQGRPNPFTRQSNLRSLYSPRAERILRVLLEEPSRRWRTRALANEAGVSIGLVSSTRKLLVDREWIADGPEGLALTEPERLLSDWAVNYDVGRSASLECYSLDGIDEVERRIADAAGKGKLSYALTGFSAAARRAPSVRYARAAAYATRDLAAVAREAGLKPVDSGANAVLMAPYDDGVYYRSAEVDGIRIVSAIQTYLDVRGAPGRGDEAAEFLLETEIRPRWNAAAPTRKKR